MQRTLDDYTDQTDSVLQWSIDRAEQLKQIRWKQIPRDERYPTWWGRLRAWNQSPKTLGELDCGSHRNYHRDDREQPCYKQHFAEIHDHTDSEQ